MKSEMVEEMIGRTETIVEEAEVAEEMMVEQDDGILQDLKVLMEEVVNVAITVIEEGEIEEAGIELVAGQKGSYCR